MMGFGCSASAFIKLRAQAIELVREGVAASDPGCAVASALDARKEMMAAARRVVLIAFGKSACLMARTALPFVGESPIERTLSRSKPSKSSPAAIHCPTREVSHALTLLKGPHIRQCPTTCCSF
ncbi:MAG: DUF4147 domain-containing protein [Mesorhizobium sp.]|nr:MAG: DUF4147 domain-containing protein [Mesorhizobium sp.]TIP40775.1 MAG: DUF4147 domain-containing protein [Mesorhizobium sp.]